jgi:hypothetical protein
LFTKELWAIDKILDLNILGTSNVVVLMDHLTRTESYVTRAMKFRRRWNGIWFRHNNFDPQAIRISCPKLTSPVFWVGLIRFNVYVPVKDFRPCKLSDSLYNVSVSQWLK